MNCKDLHFSCPSWARRGECTRNPGYMLKNCMKSCNRCSGGGGGKYCLLPTINHNDNRLGLGIDCATHAYEMCIERVVWSREQSWEGLSSVLVTDLSTTWESIATTYNSPSQGYPHPDDRTSRPHVTPEFKPFTVNEYRQTEKLAKSNEET